ncbi:hypothetical protein B0T18DRAFT_174841 [Schizothecium vesticola]|uniref:Secreted protein n=1 Tax=Schizothecium vesticola TaxID=314040 RepID=A0AA40EPE8_9PEZI|nr:hypothetical protein B0T18DRAFT_174841 [Schizothecium vesticola]
MLRLSRLILILVAIMALVIRSFQSPRLSESCFLSFCFEFGWGFIMSRPGRPTGVEKEGILEDCQILFVAHCQYIFP